MFSTWQLQLAPTGTEWATHNVVSILLKWAHWSNATYEGLQEATSQGPPTRRRSWSAHQVSGGAWVSSTSERCMLIPMGRVESASGETRKIKGIKSRVDVSAKGETADSFTSKCVFMNTTPVATLCTDHRHPAHAFQTPRPTKRDSTRSRGGDNGQWPVAVATAGALSFCRAAYLVASSGPGGGRHRLCLAGRVAWAGPKRRHRDGRRAALWPSIMRG